MKRIILTSLFMATVSGLTFAADTSSTYCPQGSQDTVNDTAKTDAASATDKSTATGTYDARASQAPQAPKTDE
ncbi:MAG: hypothetical protein COV44_02620 [Deltaproteobacteria bacterium CG11_big_fil_rev_8_21_14_0_20_45_16]|nr:MAG: hypothetical protein COV44_02620 [Deltaproteobacteria bacterium CG11_big_fil_rev_8_21_14_0_20_45_16]